MKIPLTQFRYNNRQVTVFWGDNNDHIELIFDVILTCYSVLATLGVSIIICGSVTLQHVTCNTAPLLHPSTHGTITTYFSNIQLFPQSTFNNMIAEIWNWYVLSFEGFEERNIWFKMEVSLTQNETSVTWL